MRHKHASEEQCSIIPERKAWQGRHPTKMTGSRLRPRSFRIEQTGCVCVRERERERERERRTRRLQKKKGFKAGHEVLHRILLPGRLDAMPVEGAEELEKEMLRLCVIRATLAMETAPNLGQAAKFRLAKALMGMMLLCPKKIFCSSSRVIPARSGTDVSDVIFLEGVEIDVALP
jgi:hypothetical protein